MRRRHLVPRYLAVGYLAVGYFVLYAGAGCISMGIGFPVTPPGVISPDRRAPPRVGVEVQGRWQTLVEGGLALHVEPQVAPRTSVPMTVSGGHWSGLQSRFGVRHRIYRAITLGGGVGLNAWYHWMDSVPWTPKPYIAGVFDLEVGVTGRVDWFGTTLVLRPCLGVNSSRSTERPGLFGFLELRHAWLFYVKRHTAITVRFEFGLGNDPTDRNLYSQGLFEGDPMFYYGVSVGVMFLL